MQLIRGQYNLNHPLARSVVTIGNFDGLHLGHQQVIAKLCDVAAKMNLPAVLITFEPQSKEFFSPKPTVARLMRFREKWAALQGCGIDVVFCVRFNRKFAALSPEDFVKKILLEHLGMQAVVVGDDFHFGAGAVGDFALLKQLGEQWGYRAYQQSTVILDDKRVSSSRVRNALQAGDLNEVHHLLNRPYSVLGKVSYGEQRGRQIGFPTANIHLHRDLVPLSGVFVVKAKGIAEQPLNGVANVGIRPTFAGTRVLVEVYIFDFNENIYGKNMEVEFLHKLRDEKRYGHLDELIVQIKRDVLQAKDYFLAH